MLTSVEFREKIGVSNTNLKYSIPIEYYIYAYETGGNDEIKKIIKNYTIIDQILIDIMKSTAKNKLDIIKEFINDENINSRDEEGNSALMYAIKQKNLNIVQLLIVNDAALHVKNMKDYTPLSVAVQSTDDVFNFVFDKVFHIGRSLEQNNIYVNAQYKKLSDQGTQLLFKTINSKNIDRINKIFDNIFKDIKIPLIYFVDYYDIVTDKIRNKLLEKSDKMNLNILNYIIKSRSENKEKIIMLLITDENKENKDIDGNTPLINAIIQNNVEIVKLLLDNKTDVNFKGKDGNTPLINAIIQNNVEIVKLLLDNKTDVNFKGKDGNTPLINTIIQNNVEIVKLLLGNIYLKIEKSDISKLLDFLLEIKEIEIVRTKKILATTETITYGQIITKDILQKSLCMFNDKKKLILKPSVIEFLNSLDKKNTLHMKYKLIINDMSN